MTAKTSKGRGYVKPKVRLVSWNKVLAVPRAEYRRAEDSL